MQVTTPRKENLRRRSPPATLSLHAHKERKNTHNTQHAHRSRPQILTYSYMGGVIEKIFAQEQLKEKNVGTLHFSQTKKYYQQHLGFT